MNIETMTKKELWETYLSYFKANKDNYYKDYYLNGVLSIPKIKADLQKYSNLTGQSIEMIVKEQLYRVECLKKEWDINAFPISPIIAIKKHQFHNRLKEINDKTQASKQPKASYYQNEPRIKLQQQHQQMLETLKID